MSGQVFSMRLSPDAEAILAGIARGWGVSALTALRRIAEAALGGDPETSRARRRRAPSPNAKALSALLGQIGQIAERVKAIESVGAGRAEAAAIASLSGELAEVRRVLVGALRGEELP